MESKSINEILQISESFELPERLMQILSKDEERARIFELFLKQESDLSIDWFTNYFQEEHSNRNNMMQDFTPVALCSLLPNLSKGFKNAADICAGTGGLTIGAWIKEPNAFFYCEELSARAFPLLVFNIAIRNMNALLVRKDVLSGDTFEILRLRPGDRFSDISQLKKVPDLPKFEYVMMNPPYSLKFRWNEKVYDSRFSDYGYPPSQFSDYAFVLTGLNMMQSGGTLCAILPHGVLFRGNREGIIRKKIIEKQILSAVIGLPENLFLNTNIPVCVTVFQKSTDIIFIDASHTYTKQGKQNLLESKHIEQILAAFKMRTNIEKYSHLVKREELVKNDYNMNISRYVDSFEPDELPDIVETVQEIERLNKEIRQKNRELLMFFNKLCAIGERDSELKKVIEIWGRMIDESNE